MGLFDWAKQLEDGVGQLWGDVTSAVGGAVHNVEQGVEHIFQPQPQQNNQPATPSLWDQATSNLGHAGGDALHGNFGGAFNDLLAKYGEKPAPAPAPAQPMFNIKPFENTVGTVLNPTAHLSQIAQGAMNIANHIPTGISSSIDGQPSLTVGEIAAQLPGAAMDEAIRIAQAAPQSLVRITNQLSNRPTYDPAGTFEKALLGNKSIGNLESYGRDTANTIPDLGTNLPTPVAIGVGSLMAGLDLTPFGLGKKQVVEELAKAGTEADVRKVLARQMGDSSSKIPQAAVDALVAEKNPTKVSSILKGNVPEQPTAPVDSAIASTPKETQAYLKQLDTAQESARGKTGFVSNVRDEFGTKMIDALTPLEAPMRKAIKDGAQIAPERNLTYQLDRVLRSSQPATQFIEDHGLDKLIQEVPNPKEFDQYLIAKHEPERRAAGFTTGRDATKDAKLVEALAPKYEPYAQAYQAYKDKLLALQAKPLEQGGYGLIDEKLPGILKEKYPNHVPYNRIFSEDELAAKHMGNGGGPASVSSGVIKKAEGSTRQIESPMASLLQQTEDVFKTGERNRAADIMASYKDLPGNPYDITPILADGVSNGKPTFSVIRSGVKEIYQTSPEIAAAAKNMNPAEIGLLGKIFAVPARALRLGATGINAPFVFGNIAKDQATAFVNADKGLRSSVLNPANFLSALGNALKHGEEYKELRRNAAGGTSFDISRNEAPNTVERIRASRSAGSRIMYTARHPSEVIRAAENAIGRSEELTRIQVNRGHREAYIKLGATPENAAILAAHQARNNTTNFARMGEYMRVVNSALPYTNAAVQGTRTFMRNLRDKPLQTLTKTAMVGTAPLTIATIWNNSDPKRKAAYDDIRKNHQYELQNNIVILPPDPVQDPKTGRWNAIKIPLSQDIANFIAPARRTVESLANSDPGQLAGIADDLFQAITTLPASGAQLAGQLTPQALKPGLESLTNTNLFTGNKIVPDYLKNEAPQDQYKPSTSMTARMLGSTFGISPLKIENFASTAFGGVGGQVINAIDQTMADLGVIQQNQVGGKDIGTQISQRFTSAAGTTPGGAYAQAQSAAVAASHLSKPAEDTYYGVIHPSKKDPQTGLPTEDPTSEYNTAQKAVAYLKYPELFALDKQLAQTQAAAGEPINPIFNLSPEATQAALVKQTAGLFPGELSSDKKQLSTKLPADYQNQLDAYYAAIKSKLGAQTASSNMPTAPTPSAAVKALLDAGGNSKDPSVQAYLGQVADYNNQKRKLMGLPEIASYGFAPNDGQIPNPNNPYAKKAQVGGSASATFASTGGSGGSGGSRGGRKAANGSKGGKLTIPKGSGTKTFKMAKIKSIAPPKIASMQMKATTIKKVKLAKIAKPKLAKLA